MIQSKPELRGNLDEFWDWAAGTLRNGPRAGAHYQVLDAIERYQMFLISREESKLELMQHQTKGEV